MNKKKGIQATVKLSPRVVQIPDGGLSSPLLRAEVSEVNQPDSWIAEIKVIGDLPWRPGEERIIELRIMSEKFSEYVTKNHPSLIVKRGGEIFGRLTF